MNNMLKMVNMELPDKNKKDETGGCVTMPVQIQENKYPYGLLLRLDSEQMSALPITDDLDVGDKVIVHAECSIVSKRLNEQKDKDEERSMEIQIEEMSIMPKPTKKLEDMDFEEYRAARKRK